MAHEPSIVPRFSSADPRPAMDVLERAFGLERAQAVDGQAVDGQDGALLHAEMRHGDGVVMLGTGRGPRAARRASTAS